MPRFQILELHGASGSAFLIRKHCYQQAPYEALTGEHSGQVLLLIRQSVLPEIRRHKLWGTLDFFIDKSELE